LGRPKGVIYKRRKESSYVNCRERRVGRRRNGNEVKKESRNSETVKEEIKRKKKGNERRKRKAKVQVCPF
jgi:hypothetical protein